jgi:hypothetical protein
MLARSGVPRLLLEHPLHDAGADAIELADVGFDAFAEGAPVYRSRPPAVPTPS